jgi:hypothetical protein
MTPRRRWQQGMNAVAARAVAVLSLAFFLMVFGRESVAEGTPPAPPTEAVQPLGGGTVTAGPPTTGPTVATIETTPTIPSTVEGFLPIDSGPVPTREVDEGAALNIFADPAVAKKLLFGRKVFVYDPKGRPDPMVVPWIRTEIIGTELINQALAYIKQAEASTDLETKRTRYMEAQKELDQVVKADPTSVMGKNAQDLIEKVRKIIPPPEKPGTVTPTPTPRIEFPPWVRANTKGIVIDRSPKQENRVLVGDDMLKVGSTVPKFPGVKIIEINRDSVVYEFESARITVNVEIETTRAE